MASHRSITELAEVIARDTAVLNKYFEDSKLSKPSFNEDGPSNIAIPPTAPDVNAAHGGVVEATRELNSLLTGPAAAVRGMSTIYDLVAMQFIHRFQIARHVPAGGDISFENLAKEAGVDQGYLTRILRHAFTNWLFKEARPGFVGHTAATRAMHDNQINRDSFAILMDETMCGGFAMVDAVDKYGASQEPTESGWACANRATAPMFAELALHHPDRSTTFTRMLDAYAAQMPKASPFDTYDFSAGGQTKTFIDIGGGAGPVAIELATRFPKIHCTVQDLPEPIKAGNAKRDTLPQNLKDRVVFEEHDMFTPQPIHGADIYFFRAVMHNWSDSYVVKILRALIPALKPGARVVLCEPVLPEAGSMEMEKERWWRVRDLNMLNLFNSRERTARDWEGLWEKVDARFKAGVSRPVEQMKGMLWVMEGVWEG